MHICSHRCAARTELMLSSCSLSTACMACGSTGWMAPELDASTGCASAGASWLAESVLRGPACVQSETGLCMAAVGSASLCSTLWLARSSSSLGRLPGGQGAAQAPANASHSFLGSSGSTSRACWAGSAARLPHRGHLDLDVLASGAAILSRLSLWAAMHPYLQHRNCFRLRRAGLSRQAQRAPCLCVRLIAGRL